jgi:hypothetical protein
MENSWEVKKKVRRMIRAAIGMLVSEEILVFKVWMCESVYVRSALVQLVPQALFS